MSRGLPIARVEGGGVADHLRRAAARIKYAVRIGFVVVVGAGGFASMAAVTISERPDRVHEAYRRQERERAVDGRGCAGAADECREAVRRSFQDTFHAPPAVRIDDSSFQPGGADAEDAATSIPFARSTLLAP